MKQAALKVLGHRATHAAGALFGLFTTVVVPAMDMLPADAHALKVGNTTLGFLVTLIVGAAKVFGWGKKGEAPGPVPAKEMPETPEPGKGG